MRLFITLHFALIATFISATPFTVSVSKQHKDSAYFKRSTADQARAVYLQRCTNGEAVDVPVINVANIMYITNVGIGNPPTYYNLLMDTGSFNTFCGAQFKDPYVRTTTSVPTGQAVNATYGTSSFSGMEYLDQVTLAPNLIINNQSISDALNSFGFQIADGILGVGPMDLTKGTLSSDQNATIPTVMDNLVSQGLIEKAVLGVYFAPVTNVTELNGALTFGGVDTSLYFGELAYVPLMTTHPASHYWGFNIFRASYGEQVIISSSIAGFVDTSTSYRSQPNIVSVEVLLPSAALDLYVNAIPGATYDDTTGLLEIPSASIKSMKPLNFIVDGNMLIMDAAAQLVPKNQNKY